MRNIVKAREALLAVMADANYYSLHREHREMVETVILALEKNMPEYLLKEVVYTAHKNMLKGASTETFISIGGLDARPLFKEADGFSRAANNVAGWERCKY